MRARITIAAKSTPRRRPTRPSSASRAHALALAALLVPQAAAATSAAKEAAEAAPEEPAAPETGSISGTVRFSGEEAEGERIDMPRELRTMCGVFKRITPYDMGRGGVLANVVVSVLEAPEAPAAGEQLVQLSMRRCEWSPSVMSATVGQVLDLHNRDDALLRPVLSWQGHPEGIEHDYRVQRMWLPKKGQHAATRLGSPGTLQVGCEDERPWAQAIVRVYPHPFHAVTDESGSFEITGLPPGSYHLVAWDRTLGEVSARATVSPGKGTSVAISYELARPKDEEMEALEEEEAPEAEEPKPKPKPRPKPEAKPAEAAKPKPKPEEKPAGAAKPKPKPEAKPAEAARPKPEAKPAEKVKPEEKPEEKPKAKPGAKPKPEAQPKPAGTAAEG